MNKIDLIIDALTAFYVMAHEQKIQVYMDQSRDAFAAARELQALKPVCVITENETGQISIQTDDGKPFFINRHIGAKLYALDLEVTK
jgi:hypothetical protein